MRASARLALLAALALPALAHAQYADAPQRRPGLWDMTIAMSVGGRDSTRHAEVCTDAVSEKTSGPLPGAHAACGRLTSARTATGWTFASVCRLGKASMATTGSASGDFQSRYRVEATTTRSPAPAGAAASHMVVEARWTGPCPAGRKAGQTLIDGGRVMSGLMADRRRLPLG